MDVNKLNRIRVIFESKEKKLLKKILCSEWPRTRKKSQMNQNQWAKKWQTFFSLYSVYSSTNKKKTKQNKHKVMAFTFGLRGWKNDIPYSLFYYMNIIHEYRNQEFQKSLQIIEIHSFYVFVEWCPFFSFIFVCLFA